MKYFKKYPVFYVSILLLLVFFAAGVGYDYYLASKSSSFSKNLVGKMREYRTVLSDDPTSKAIDDSEANIKKLQERLEFLIKDLTRASGDIFKEPASEEGYQLVEQLRGLVFKWRKDASGKGILLSPDMDFGFKKYVAPGAQPPKNTAVAAIWKQACVLNYINGKLFDCKSEQSPMYILSVQRELLPQELEKSKSQTSGKARGRTFRRISEDSTGDTFRIPEAITARKVGSLDTLAYKFVFAGHTDVLRRFLNKLKDFDAMLVVRSIGVKPADPTSLPSQPVNPEDAANASAAAATSAAPQNNLDNIFGTAAAAPAAAPTAPAVPATPEAPAVDAAAADNRTPIVEDNISEFTVVIEYVEVVKEGAKSAAKADDEEEAAPEAKDKTDAKK